MQKNIADGINSKDFNFNDNCFDLLRLIGSLIVMLSHSFRHFEVNKPLWTLFFTDGSIGVMMFFSMTGFFMMPAWERAREKEKPYYYFLKNRVLKIFPPIVFSFLIISILEFFVIKEKFNLGAYVIFAVGYLGFGWGYGRNIITNGVLWTIFVDVVFYLLTPLVYKILKSSGKMGGDDNNSHYVDDECL